MKKIQLRNRVLVVTIALLPVISNAQTMPPTFPAIWLEKMIERYRASHGSLDTNLPPKRKCVQHNDNRRYIKKPDYPFVNYDSLIRKQGLRNWKRH